MLFGCAVITQLLRVMSGAQIVGPAGKLQITNWVKYCFGISGVMEFRDHGNRSLRLISKFREALAFLDQRRRVLLFWVGLFVWPFVEYSIVLLAGYKAVASLVGLQGI